MANFADEKATKINDRSDGSSFTNYVSKLFDSTLKWEDIQWLQSITKLPIILKGVLTAEDAVIGADMGVAGIIVSNHGARQLDGVPATVIFIQEI